MTTPRQMQKLSIEKQKAKFESPEAYTEEMRRRASMRKTKGNFTNHPKQEKTA